MALVIEGIDELTGLGWQGPYLNPRWLLPELDRVCHADPPDVSEHTRGSDGDRALTTVLADTTVDVLLRNDDGLGVVVHVYS
jgi:hypothetical protein